SSTFSCLSEISRFVLKATHLPARRQRPGALSVMLSGVVRRQYCHSEDCRLLVRSKRPWNLVLDWRQAFQKRDDSGGIRFRQRSIGAPWHDGRKSTAVGSDSCLDGRCDLLVSPMAESRVLVGREVPTNKDAAPGPLDPHIRAGEVSSHIRLPKKMAGCVAIGAPTELHEVLSTCHLLILGAQSQRHAISCCCSSRHRDAGQYEYKSTHVQTSNTCCSLIKFVSHVQFSPSHAALIAGVAPVKSACRGRRLASLPSVRRSRNESRSSLPAPT